MKSIRRGLALAAVTALALGALTLASPAVADPLSPATGARPSTSGTPVPGTGGAVYYVDAAAGSDTNAGTSPTAAWKTLARVTAQTFGPGDVVAFERGETFTGSATISGGGTASLPVTVTAYGTGAQPVLTNPGGLTMLKVDAPSVVVADLAFTTGVVFDNADGLGIVGPKYENSGAVAITGNGTGALVRDSTFTDVGVGVKVYGAGSKVLHNTFQHLRIAFRGMDSGHETSYGAIGVSIDNSQVEVAYNDFIDCRSTDSPYGADGGAIEIEGFLHTKDDIAIHHNYSRGSQGFLEVTETTTSKVSITENVSDDYQQFIAWDTTTTPSGYLAQNNTVIRSSDTSKLFDQYYYRVTGPTPSAAWITIRNNIFQTAGPFSFYDFPHDHNLFAPSVSLPYALGAGDLIATPAYANAAGRDYRPTQLSPAVDNGAATGVGTDLAGNPLGVGLGTDIGAFELQSSPSSTGSTLVSDGGFESQTAITATSTPWWSDGALTYGVDINAGKAHSGQDDGWIATSGTGWGALRQTVAVTPNTNYRFSVWVRTSAVVNNAWLGAKTTGGAVLGEVRHGQAGAYTRYVVTFNSGANSTAVLHVGLWGAGTGTWEQVDDAWLQQL
ncbi:choice-of-anchor Q domain-containing protein [Leifsonia aquatica]|uniref:choice-of-anchor Q domain-containing protein n=1 Tax=Leifsonia aquatica TaxID=144185 RepID=UPI00046A0DBA|nr:choice-of-anchor Q domain-containing protein [Leifsonia aquatica]